VPLSDETLALSDAEVADFEGFNAGLAVREPGFGCAGSAGENRAVVLGSETIAEGLSASAAVLNVSGHGDDDEERQDQAGDYKLGVGEVSIDAVEITLHDDLLYWGFLQLPG